MFNIIFVLGNIFLWALGIVISIKQLNTIPAAISVSIITLISITAWWISSFGIICIWTENVWELNLKGDRVFYNKKSKFITVAGNITQLFTTLLSDGTIKEEYANIDGIPSKLLQSQPPGKFLQVWQTPLKPLSLHTREVGATHINAFIKENEWALLEVDYLAITNTISVFFPRERPPKTYSGEMRIGGHKSEYKILDNPKTDGARILSVKTPYFCRPGTEFFIYWSW
ncbi:MAG: hypothetical protein AB1571_03470 [Nanoarchaeota archaeon]